MDYKHEFVYIRAKDAARRKRGFVLAGAVHRNRGGGVTGYVRRCTAAEIPGVTDLDFAYDFRVKPYIFAFGTFEWRHRHYFRRIARNQHWI